jgi:hypothetical protein
VNIVPVHCDSVNRFQVTDAALGKKHLKGGKMHHALSHRPCAGGVGGRNPSCPSPLPRSLSLRHRQLVRPQGRWRGACSSSFGGFGRARPSMPAWNSLVGGATALRGSPTGSGGHAREARGCAWGWLPALRCCGRCWLEWLGARLLVENLGCLGCCGPGRGWSVVAGRG